MKRINQNLLRKIAMRSNREQRHASIIFDHGTPISFASNNDKYHSEEFAIIQCNFEDRIALKGKIMVNIRITRGGRVGLAKPCPSCYELLRERKFRKIIYSTNDGRFVEEYL